MPVHSLNTDYYAKKTGAPKGDGCNSHLPCLPAIENKFRAGSNAGGQDSFRLNP